MSQLNQTAERAVYDALCNIFSDISPDTSKSRLKASIQGHASDPELADIIQEYSLLNVKKTALMLHENNVFSSKAIAQEYFQATMHGVEGSPGTASSNTATTAQETHSSVTTAQETHSSVTTAQETHLSAETRVPLSAQHHLLTKVQAELEAACFEFAKAKLPAILDKNNWKCAEAVELNLIAKALGKHQEHLPGVAELPEGITVGKLLGAMESIRHAAVHREYLQAKELLVMLRDSESLLIVFKDENRLASVRSLREEVKKCVIKLDEDEANVKQSIATAHEDATVQIARLRQQEDEAVAQAESRRDAFHCLYAEQITTMVANFHVKGATQIRQPSSRAVAATVLLFFARCMRGTVMFVLDIVCRLFAMLAEFFV